MTSHTYDQPVIAWPKLTATIDDARDNDAGGSLVINGVMHPCWAENTEILRTGMIARCTATAITLGRPVRVDVTEAGQSWTLAIRPDGIVQELDQQGRMITTDDELVPIEGACRRCGKANPVNVSHCTACGVDEPLGVLAAEPYAITSAGRTVD